MVKGSTAWGRLKVRSPIAALQTERERETNERERKSERGERG